MKVLVQLALVFISFNCFATTHEVGIVDLLNPDSDSYYLVLGTDGRVFEIENSKYTQIDLIREALEKDLKVNLVLEDTVHIENVLDLRNRIIDVQLTSLEKESFSAPMSTEKDFNYIEDYSSPLLNDYITDFDSYNDARYYFNTMRTDTRNKSQCYNRAHVWSWELFQKSYNGRRIQTGKIWLFFTQKYIRSYNHKWWFHVAPTVKVEGTLHVMDRSFSQMPLYQKVWTDTFIKSRQQCIEVYRYSGYSKGISPNHCFVINTSVHYWQPFQVENQETRGEEQRGWNDYEIKKAYKNAIGWFATPAGFSE